MRSVACGVCMLFDHHTHTLRMDGDAIAESCKIVRNGNDLSKEKNTLFFPLYASRLMDFLSVVLTEGRFEN